MSAKSPKFLLLFSLSLIAVMILPFSSMAFADVQSTSLYKQIRDNIIVENLQCSNDKLLVERNNSKLACVSQDTQIKNEWIALNTEPFIGGSDNANGEPRTDFVTAELSNLPLLNEVVTLTLTNPSISSMGGVMNLDNLNEPEEQKMGVNFDDGWEFVNLPNDNLSAEPMDDSPTGSMW